mmetsp:Transcript_90341/g.141609  ORF Transcript_90341/g.141609 Transcript_90341/m.141609 type:complete len:201 (+) Transcript_90341:464-1066(+)
MWHPHLDSCMNTCGSDHLSAKLLDIYLHPPTLLCDDVVSFQRSSAKGKLGSLDESACHVIACLRMLARPPTARMHSIHVTPAWTIDRMDRIIIWVAKEAIRVQTNDEVAADVLTLTCCRPRPFVQGGSFHLDQGCRMHVFVNDLHPQLRFLGGHFCHILLVCNNAFAEFFAHFFLHGITICWIDGGFLAPLRISRRRNCR